MKVAIVQMRSVEDPWENLLIVQNFIVEAESLNCAFVCFPENVFYRGPRQTKGFSRQDICLHHEPNYGLLPKNEFSKALKEVFQNLKLTLSLGSVLEANPLQTELPFNAHWLVRPPSLHSENENIESYKKIHLFEFQGIEGSYSESKDVMAGSHTKVTSVGEFNMGLSICYDLRFPELYRDMVLKQGANVLLVPAAFTLETGLVHWHTLLRARAIENLSYVLAPAQWGSHLNSLGKPLDCFGHALAYDPWGELLVDGQDSANKLLLVNLDMHQIRQRRMQLPALDNAKFFHSK